MTATIEAPAQEAITLTIERQGYEAHAYECDRCGWSRDKHPAPHLPQEGRNPK